jgi:hypothetical protein
MIQKRVLTVWPPFYFGLEWRLHSLPPLST